MADYRLFFLGSDGAVEARHDFGAPDDDSALQIMAVIGKASADSHHGVMLWQGTRRIFEIDGVIPPGDGNGHGNGAGGEVLDRLTAARLSAETQQHVLDCEEALLKSHWRLAKSQALLRATTELRGSFPGEPPPGRPNTPANVAGSDSERSPATPPPPADVDSDPRERE